MDEVDALVWAGGPLHLDAVRAALIRADRGEVIYLGVEHAGELVSIGGVDMTRIPGSAVLWMLSTHPQHRSMGFGSLLIKGLEDAAADAGVTQFRLEVEKDNPRARQLYGRLGYEVTGSTVQRWDVVDGSGARVTHHADCSVMTRRGRPGVHGADPV